MNRITIQQLRQMHESEDRVEFKAGEGGGRLVISMQDNYPHDHLFLFRALPGENQHEIARNVGTVENGRIDDMINLPINPSGLATMFNVSEKTIKLDLYVLRDLNLSSI